MFYFVHLFLIACVLAIWPMAPNDVFWKPKEIVFIVGALALIQTIFLNRSVITFKNKYLTAVSLYVTVLFAYYFLCSLLSKNLTVNVWNLLPSLNAMLAVLLIVALVKVTNSLDDWLKLTKTLSALSVCVACYAIFQYFGFDTFSVKMLHSNPIFTVFGNTFLTACFLSITAPFLLVYESKTHKVCFAIVLLAILLCDSLMGMIAISTSTVLYYLLLRKWKVVLGVLSLIAVCIYWFSPTHNIVFFDPIRWALWTDVINQIKESTLIGNGLGSFALQDWTNNITSSNTHAAHNDFLQLWYEGGIVLLVLLGFYFKDLFNRLRQMQGSRILYGYVTSFVAFLLNMLTAFPMRIAGIAVVGILTVAFMEVYAHDTI